MEINIDDLTILIYNYAVVLTASYPVALYDLDGQVLLLGAGLLLALFWTGYFRYRIRPRFEQDESDE